MNDLEFGEPEAAAAMPEPDAANGGLSPQTILETYDPPAPAPATTTTNRLPMYGGVPQILSRR